MLNRHWVLLPIIAYALHLSMPAKAQITANVDKLDISDGLVLPARHLVVVDVAIDVGSADGFAGLGIGTHTLSGAELVYARDKSGQVITTAPGVENRFVTFFSRPRLRDGNGRFTSTGAIGIGGPNCIGANAFFLPTLLDAFSIVNSSEPGRDGYVFRLTLDLSNVAIPSLRCDSQSIVLSTVPLPDAIALCETACHDDFDAGVLVASQFSFSTQFGFGVYGVPCPGDVNGDGTRDIYDLTLFLSAFGEPNQPCADLDGDGSVGLADLTELLANFGIFCPAIP